jgi:hypothetical protein
MSEPNVTRIDSETQTEVPSTIEGRCERCGTSGMVGDYPGQGGIVADAHGHMLCDECATEED